MIASLAKLALVPAVALGLGACSTARVFTVIEDSPVPAGCCHKPDRLDVVLLRPTFNEDKAVCNNMGGRIVARQFPNGKYYAVCENVDY